MMFGMAQGGQPQIPLGLGGYLVVLRIFQPYTFATYG